MHRHLGIRRAVRVGVALGLLQALALLPRTARAQSTAERPVMQQGRAAAVDSSHADSSAAFPRPRIAPLFDRRDAMIAGAFALGTAAMFPLDEAIARQLQDSTTQANGFLRGASKGFEGIASPGAYFIGGSMLVIGRVAGLHRLADLGWHGTEAVLLSEGVGYLLKRTIGRARPYMSDATNSTDFTFNGGFQTGDRRSLPSGHTYTAFSAASVVTSEMEAWKPGSSRIVGPLMYGGASMVGLSRMYHNKHWASDVVLGAAIGTFSGRKVVQWSHAHPDNLIDRIMLGTTVMPNGRGGAQLGWSTAW